MKPLIVITGPTAVGKSRLALELGERFTLPILSCDALQVYRHFSIGLDKPTAEMQRRVVHGGIDLVEPGTPFSAGEWARMADQWIVSQSSPAVIVVGGCGLYLRSLIYGIDDLPRSTPELRLKIDQQFGTDPAERYQALLKINSTVAVRIHPNDHYRIGRALELAVSENTQKTAHENLLPIGRPVRYSFAQIALTDDRELLYRRINSRIDSMIERGLMDEIDELIRAGLDLPSHPAHPAKSIGYRYFFSYKSNALSYEEALVLTKRDSRRYAKRQFTWLRAENDALTWISRGEWSRAYQITEQFIRAADTVRSA